MELIVLNKDLHFGIYRAARMAVLLQIIEGRGLKSDLF
jgi:DNA-binding GntR family transcriptional regulator